MSVKWLWAGALVLAACTGTRELVLSIDTTAAIPCDIDRIRVTATASGTTVFERSLQGVQLPIDITLLDDTPNGSFDLTVAGLKDGVEMMRVHGPLSFSDQKATNVVLLDPQCTTDTQCGLDEAMSGTTPTARSICRYSANPTTETFVNACDAHDHVEVIPGATPVSLITPQAPITGFRFYGEPVRQIWIAKDGYISFTQASPDPRGDLKPGPLDRGITLMGDPPPRQSVMAFWQTLSFCNPVNSTVCYNITGSPGNQVFNVTWRQACMTAMSADDLNFTITLEERTQRVVIGYGPMSSTNKDQALGARATVGLVKNAIGCPATECALATGLCQDGITACGYSQVFSSMIQDTKEPSYRFLPVDGSR